MNKVSIRVYPWESPKIFRNDNFDLEEGDQVIVETEQGIENGEVVAADIEDGGKEDKEEEKSVLRRANASDTELIKRYQKKRKEALDICRAEIKKNNLPMKLADARFSFDGSKITFPFTAEKRVDFRNLIRTLSQRFQKSVRLQQIGSRDETRASGGFGVCGRELCCGVFGGNLKSVTAENARVQQLGQRGSDRISGLCGRLRCCLGYESEQYKKASVDFPGLWTKIKVNGKDGKIIERHILAREVTVEFKDRTRKRMKVEDVG